MSPQDSAAALELEAPVAPKPKERSSEYKKALDTTLAAVGVADDVRFAVLGISDPTRETMATLFAKLHRRVTDAEAAWKKVPDQAPAPKRRGRPRKTQD